MYADVGIDAVGFYAPRHRVSTEDLALERGVDPNKYSVGLLTREFAIPDPGEDAVSMAVLAAEDAFQRGGISPRDIDAVFVGSESFPYAVKPMASVIMAFLNVSERCFALDTLNACAGATTGFLCAAAMVEAGMIGRALVIGADVARYATGSAEEATQGAAATALIISRSPRVAHLCLLTGRVSGHINDFYRPLGSPVAECYGRYSCTSYLDLAARAHDHLTAQLGRELIADHYLFHAPFAKMVVKCFQHLIVERWINDERRATSMEDRANSVERTAAATTTAADDRLTETLDGIADAFARQLSRSSLPSFWAKTHASWLRNKIAPVLSAPMHFGNSYCSSLWAQLVCLLESSAARPGDEIVFTSYGSGGTCVVGALRVAPAFADVVKATGTALMRDRALTRVLLSVQEYDARFSTDSCPDAVSVVTVIPSDDNCTIRAFTVCSCGCVLPEQEALRSCPQGHAGARKMLLPRRAVVRDVVRVGHMVGMPTPEGDDRAWCIALDVCVGDEVELVVRRLCPRHPLQAGNGLVHWYPVYAPCEDG